MIREYSIILQTEDVDGANLTRWRLLLRGAGFEEVLAESSEFTGNKDPTEMFRTLLRWSTLAPVHLP